MAEAQKLTETSLLLRAIAHPVRLKIILLLDEHGELSFSALIKHLNKSHTGISHELIRMKTNGLLKLGNKSRNVFYSLVESDLLDCIKVFIHSRIV